MEALLFSTAVVAVAEMGDKTQFAALAASANSDKTWPVLLAVVLALALAGTLGVLFGKLLGLYLPAQYLKPISGGLFILMGVWILLGKS